MKGKKLLFLFLALLLPVAIFIFLKVFGENEFQVEVMHQNGEITAPPGCDFQYATPYRIPDSVITARVVNRADSLYVFYFGTALKTAMNRVSVEFGNDAVRIVSGEDSSKKSDGSFFRHCILLMNGDTSVALVDHKNRIRGYYDGMDRDEVDRLIVEIKIILRKY